MPRRHLFGPVDAAFSDQCLGPAREAGWCKTFGLTPGADLTLRPGDGWEDICVRLPDGWRPDFVALQLAYTHVPAALWSAPVPLVGLAGDWNLLWHHYRHCLPRCDLVLTDRAGVERLARAGLPHAHFANLYGCPRGDVEGPWPNVPRDIDILFVGNFQDAVQRERLAWLARLAELGDRWRVVLRTAIYGPPYRELLARARVVFNRSIRGECNQRAFEAAAAGALLFQEAANHEVPDYFTDRREYVAYTDADLEGLLDYYLTHEDERQVLAAAARARVRGYRYADLWDRALTVVEEQWPALEERARRRPRPSVQEDLVARAWQELCSVPRCDATLAVDLAAAIRESPSVATLHDALGLVAGLAKEGQDPGKAAAVAVEHFRGAVACGPDHVLAHLNLAEALAAAGQSPAAIDQARQALDALDRLAALPPAVLAGFHFPPGYDFFRVEWERAAWAHAGDPAAEARAKRDLLTWRLHGLLARETGFLVHRYEAALARPDLPATRAALAASLIRAGRPGDALPHLRRALADNPFDRASAQTLFDVLGTLGKSEARRRLVQARRLLSRAAPQVVPPEPWFTGEVPGEGLASLVVLCCNELPYTRLCLESVLRHTRSPYELIVVDNGSTDGTPAYLEEIRSRAGPARVEVVRNAANRGFTAGCNQGLARAAGRYLVLLNNDTVVTEGWLEVLTTCLERHGPTAGLIGPVSNATAAPQQIAVDYTDLSGLDAFAARRRHTHGTQGQPAQRLAGFCLLIRREVLDAIGGLDEGYGVGFFDDFDLCVRAQEAGYFLLVAPGVFIHHALSRTFAGLGIDVPRQFQANFERFLGKWGRERVERYLEDMRDRLPPLPPQDAADGAVDSIRADKRDRLPPSLPEGPPSSPRESRALPLSGNGARAKVSLCMIVRDEASNLPVCLSAVSDLVEEIIVVDTGSTDDTRQIAAACGARVFDFPWCDSFAAARNESLRHATGEWIFWLDADDRLDGRNRAALRALFAGLDGATAAYLMPCVMEHGATESGLTVDHVRLFRNDPRFRWEYRVHEQILAAVQRAGGAVRHAPVIIRHAGYEDPAGQRRKLERNLRLLRLERAERPEDPFTLFNLGSVYLDMGRAEEAVPLLEHSLRVAPPDYPLRSKLHVLLTCAFRQLGRPDEALRVCRAGRQRLPREPELLFYEALLVQEGGDPRGAEACLRELLRLPPPSNLTCNDLGLRGYKTRHNLAIILRDLGRPAEAEAEWRAALAEREEFVPAWLGLADLFVAQGRGADLEREIARLSAKAPTRETAELLRARLLLAGKEFRAAEELLEAAALRCPYALWPRMLLGEARWREGKDPAATEQALRDILALDPGHVQSRQRLARLSRKDGAVAGAEGHIEAAPRTG